VKGKRLLALLGEGPIALVLRRLQVKKIDGGSAKFVPEKRENRPEKAAQSLKTRSQ